MDGGDGWSFYNYLGILALPLAFLGFLYSKSYWRIRLFILSILYFSILIFQNYSPLFFPFLSLNTLLTSISHFNDLTYRSGGFIIILLAAGLGFEALCEDRLPKISKLLILSSSLLFSLMLMRALNISNLYVYGFLLGFMGILSVSCLTVFSWLDKTKSAKSIRTLYFRILLAITAIDVLTISHLHIRTNFFPTFLGIQNSYERYDKQNIDKIGLQNIYVNANATTTLQAKTYIKLLDLDIEVNKLPQQEIYENFYLSDEVSNIDIENAIARKSLMLSKTAENAESLNSINKSNINLIGNIVDVVKTYNTQDISVSTNKPAILFIRDARHPYWHAEINGEPVELLTAVGHYKAIVLPAGTSKVHLWFKPFGVFFTIALAYSFLVALIVALGFKVMKIRKSQ